MRAFSCIHARCSILTTRPKPAENMRSFRINHKLLQILQSLILRKFLRSQNRSILEGLIYNAVDALHCGSLRKSRERFCVFWRQKRKRVDHMTNPVSSHRSDHYVTILQECDWTLAWHAHHVFQNCVFFKPSEGRRNSQLLINDGLILIRWPLPDSVGFKEKCEETAGVWRSEMVYRYTRFSLIKSWQESARTVTQSHWPPSTFIRKCF